MSSSSGLLKAGNSSLKAGPSQMNASSLKAGPTGMKNKITNSVSKYFCFLICCALNFLPIFFMKRNDHKKRSFEFYGRESIYTFSPHFFIYLFKEVWQEDQLNLEALEVTV